MIQGHQQMQDERQRVRQLADQKETEQLKEANEALIERLAAEKDLSERELSQIQTSYHEKFIQLKERETLLELQLAALDKELKVGQDDLW